MQSNGSTTRRRSWSPHLGDAALVVLFLAVDFFPRHGPPAFRYTGCDPQRAVWNLGWPLATAIVDPRTGLHAAPHLHLMIGFQAVVLAATWITGRLLRPPRHLLKPAPAPAAAGAGWPGPAVRRLVGSFGGWWGVVAYAATLVLAVGLPMWDAVHNRSRDTHPLQPDRLWLRVVGIACTAANFAIVGMAVYRAGRLATRLRKGLCPTCGYDLRASTGRCPECGAPPSARPAGVITSGR